MLKDAMFTRDGITKPNNSSQQKAEPEFKIAGKIADSDSPKKT